jgi:hypothetical protein
MTTEHEKYAPETITLLQLARMHAQTPLQAARMVAFIEGWQELTEIEGKAPTQGYYAIWSGQSITTAERLMAEFRALYELPSPNALPSAIARLPLDDPTIYSILTDQARMIVAE